MRPLHHLLLSLTLVSLAACGDKSEGDSGTTDSSTDGTTDSSTDGTTDSNTDGTTDPGPVDADGDGFPEAEDCDDSNPDVHPSADEVCDGVDKARPEA